MSQHVMLDWETWSTCPNALPMALGAVKYDPFHLLTVPETTPVDHEAIARGLDAFYVIIDPRPNTYGLKVDFDTIVWWMSPELEAPRARMHEAWSIGNCVTLEEALQGFNDWLAESTNDESDLDVLIWGNGANFDNPIAAEAYRAAGVEQPWPFWKDRCYRTDKAKAPDLKMTRIGTPHHARDDAMSQAIHHMEIVRRLGLRHL